MANQYTKTLCKFSIEPVAAPVSVACEHDYATPHKTGVVVGIPQGGTSMVAAAIDALGVPVSRQVYNFEADGRPNVVHDETTWAATAAEMNTKLDVWGMKDTMIWRFPPEAIHGYLRNPYYLVVTRDSIAITQRRCANFKLNKPEQYFGVLKHQVRPEYEKMWGFVDGLPPAPLLLISCERVFRNREAFCEATAAFLGLAPSPEELQRASDRISPVGGYFLGEEKT